MWRRTFLTLIGGGFVPLSGCLSTPSNRVTSGNTSTMSQPLSAGDAKSGTVDNHRITAVEAISHKAVRRTTADGDTWVVTVTLRLKPQDEETVTVYPIGVFFVFFDADGQNIFQVYKTVSANTGSTPTTVSLSATFRPTEASADTFHRYRIDLVHA